MEHRPKQVAVVGSGYWGKNLVRNFYQLETLKWVCDQNETILSGFKNQYPDIETTTSYQQILEDPDVEGIVVATPAETHYSLARDGLLAGKHVYVEKPLVLHEDEGIELINLAEENGRILMVGHLLQYHPAFIKLKELVDGGELGRINYIYSNRLNLGKIRREENILWSFAPHDISMILALTGELPEWVMATGGNYLHQKIADVTTTHLEFPSGIRGHIFVSWLHPIKEQKLVVVGDKKMAVFNDTLPWDQKLYIYPHEISWKNNVPIPTKADPERIPLTESEPLEMECRQFLKCIQEGCVPKTDGNEGLRVLRVLNAGEQSLKQCGKKIRLSEGEPQSETSGASSSEGNGYFAHESAALDADCQIGQGTKIWHFSHVLKKSRIGDNCNIGQNVVIGPKAVIGNGCKVQNNVSVYQGVTLEDEVFCGPSMVFTNVYNPRAAIRRMDEAKATLVHKGATLGANCTIVCGITIGRYAFVGAGTVVLKDVPDFAMVVGNPAVIKGWMCACGHRIHFDGGKGICRHCNMRYTKAGNAVQVDEAFPSSSESQKSNSFSDILN